MGHSVSRFNCVIDARGVGDEMQVRVSVLQQAHRREDNNVGCNVAGVASSRHTKAMKKKPLSDSELAFELYYSSLFGKYRGMKPDERKMWDDKCEAKCSPTGLRWLAVARRARRLLSVDKPKRL